MWVGRDLWVLGLGTWDGGKWSLGCCKEPTLKFMTMNDCKCHKYCPRIEIARLKILKTSRLFS